MSNPTAAGHTYKSYFQTCQRKFYWRFVRHLVPREEEPPLVIGTLVHKALEVLPQAGLATALEAARAKYDELITSVPADEAPSVWPVVEALVRGYHKTYERDEFTTLLTEFEDAIELVDEETGQKFLYTVRFDKIVTANDRFFVKEHKTSGESPTQLFRRFSMDGQITGYYLAASKALGQKPLSGVIIDALFKPRLRADGSLGQVSFARELFTRTAEEIESFVYETIQVFKQIEAKPKDDKRSWLKNTSACFGPYGTPCPYLDLCRWGSKYEDELIARMYKHDHLV